MAERTLGQWAALALTSTHASVADGAKSLWTESRAAVGGFTSKVTALFSPAPSSAATATSEARADAQSVPDPVQRAITEQEMASLMAQTYDTAYPVMPHTPVVVAAASCQDVVLRWRSIEDADWPVHEYVLQRFPDSKHEKQWETLLESNASDATDRKVRAAQQYLYRVQAVSGKTRSAFAYHSVAINESACFATKSFINYLPKSLHGIPGLNSMSVEAIQTFVLIITCFLAVFAVMRANVTRMQHTRSRQGRLRKMQKSALAETTVTKTVSLPRLSSSDSSTEPSTSVADLQHSSSRGSQFESISARMSLAPSDVVPVRAASFGSSVDKAACTYCRKKFGIFRRRRICDVCEAVTLCRKCGFQAPVDCNVEVLRESLVGRDSVVSTSRASASGNVRQRRVKTICRDCCAQAQRLSSAASGRPSTPLR